MLCRIILIFTALLLAGFSAVSATEQKYTIEFPYNPADPLPEWIETPVQEENTTLATLHIPIQFNAHPSEAEDLAVTVYFIEPADGFLRLYWVSSEEDVTLSSNLYEGIGAAHQRTILIPKKLLQTNGVLTLQNSDAETSVYAVRLEWLNKRSVLGSGQSDQNVQLSNNQQLDSRALSGFSYLPPMEGWSGDVVTAILSERVESLEEGAEFLFELEAVPLQVRFSLSLANADLSQPILVWINGTYAGFLNIHIPSLQDEGYYEDETAKSHYAGWRNGAVFLPGHLFQKGENTLRITYAVIPKKNPAAKDIVLQLRYPDIPFIGSEKLGNPPDFMNFGEEKKHPQFRFDSF